MNKKNRLKLKDYRKEYYKKYYAEKSIIHLSSNYKRV